jgi:hypothetical protein
VVWCFLMWEDPRKKARRHPRKMYLHLNCGHASSLVMLCCPSPNTVQVRHLIWAVFLKGHAVELSMLGLASLHLAEVAWKGVDHGDRMVEGTLPMWGKYCALWESRLACYIPLEDCLLFFFAICEPHEDLTQREGVVMGLEVVLEIVSHPYQKVGSKTLLSRRSRYRYRKITRVTVTQVPMQTHSI